MKDAEIVATRVGHIQRPMQHVLIRIYIDRCFGVRGMRCWECKCMQAQLTGTGNGIGLALVEIGRT